jgi:anthranilate phosphoribosyltransferase
MLGVYSPKLLDVYAKVLAALGVQHALVVHCCGLDELAPIGIAEAREIVADGTITSISIDATAWMPRCSIESLAGGAPQENAEIIRQVFQGGAAADSPVGHTIALNAGAALYVAGTADSVEAGYRQAYAVLAEGGAATQLSKWAQVSSTLAAKSAGQVE